ncbi:nicotinate-nucleotide adenylyltransferase [Paludisphaera mucosa]|uniref:Probable nicotinate-nucleotide adenylyltransferase n=1 Tax=Paludisphaera mucosa TaxID=3030827 RepID=A0ABT6F4N1_9BACT|nr:nicotinate-nucleotide adenylyltransferase [Paludisphaera mucosa]MDG3002538.1 nicotinate-nucleotide adenylyltransferase [Paludisphaera mucosa]
MRLGLFGGTFDPIHMGHLILAEQCREACGLDRVWFVVANEPPHKRGAKRSGVHHRLEMARLAIAGNAAFEVSDIEANRSGPSYSVDTLEQIRAERPEDELFFLIGGDSLVDLPTWREPDRIARLATIVVVNRPGSGADAPPADSLGPDARTLEFVTIPPIGIASHDVRGRLRDGRSIRYMVPRSVEAYIDAHALYREPSAPPA